MSVTATTTRPIDVTAEIVVPRVGDPYLKVVVDGRNVTVNIRTHLLKLHDQTPTQEADRLLVRHAGYAAGEWTTDADGRLTATVAEITGRCVTCVHGCGCAVDQRNCGHYECPGKADGGELVHSCDGAALAVNAKRPNLRSIAGRNYAKLAAPRGSRKLPAARRRTGKH